MKLKKIMALALSVVTAASVFAGCGGSSDGASADGKPVTLKWYTVGRQPKDIDKVLEKANSYLEEKINVNLDMNFIDFGDYTQKMSVIINSGESYDLAFTCSWAGDYFGNAAKGAFLDVTSYLDDKGKDMKAAIDERFWNAAKVDNKIFAVPNQKEIGAAPMWAFTKEYVDKYKIPYQDIHSLEDLEPWLEKIKKNEPGVTPFYITKGFSWEVFFDPIVAPVGFALDDKDLKAVNMFEHPEMKKNLETIRRFYQKGYINADSATAQDDKSIKRFVTKGDGQPYAEKIWSKTLGYDVVSSEITEAVATNGSATGAMTAISKNSKNPEKAIEFLNLVNTDEYLRNLLNYGIEGEHYTKVSDKTIKIDEAKKKDYDMVYYGIGNMFNTYVLEGEPETKWEEFKKFNDEAKLSPALGFRFNPENVTTEIAAINNVLEEFKATVYSGSVDPTEYLNKLNAKLKEQGIDKVVAEVQKQVDEWKATK
ncbi:MAG: ABC transporter substrate-binding protein [Clostridium sp.]|uniref:ABC transporter substrate-binding protein n=1 Tax=Clostridium sp. TaxID=1506 RepID=UPI003EE55554